MSKHEGWADRFNWTAEAVDALKAAWLAGRTPAQIGAALGVSAAAVIGKLTRLGLGRRIKVRRYTRAAWALAR
jgi:hypothetical protein